MSNEQNLKFKNIFSELLKSYKICIQNKAHLKKKKFHYHHEFLLEKLASDIYHNKYYPSKSSVFIVLHPKPREVVAAGLRDRVVHHYLYKYMSPYWEKRFHPNSYACRVGKGPLQGALDAQRFLRRSAYHSTKKKMWCLQVDVQSFFASINKNILFRIIKSKMTNKHILNLSEKVLFHNPMLPGNYVLTSPPEWHRLVPKYKSLFYTKEHVGLPIGNLTSQFWANVYMNELDQWLARHCKGKVLFWQRYVDDVSCFSTDRKFLAALPKQIDAFLQEKLALRLNPKKTILQPVSRGFDHLGYFFKNGGMQVRQSVVNRAKWRLHHTLEQSELDKEKEHVELARINSFLGHCSHAEAYHLRHSMIQKALTSPLLRNKIEVKVKSKNDRASSLRFTKTYRMTRKDDFESFLANGILEYDEIAKKQFFIENYINAPWRSGLDEALYHVDKWYYGLDELSGELGKYMSANEISEDCP